MYDCSLPLITPLSLSEFVDLDCLFVRLIERERLRAEHFESLKHSSEARVEAAMARRHAREYADILNTLRSHYLVDMEDARDLL